MKRLLVLLPFLLPGCGDAPVRAPSGPQGELRTVRETGGPTMPSPGGAVSLAVREDGGPTLVLSAGFLKRGPVAKTTLPADLSWSPDSRRFFVNDRPEGRARFRIWTVDGAGRAVESQAARRAAVQALARLNGCPEGPEGAVDVAGTGWGDDGRAVFLTVEARAPSPACAFDKVSRLTLAVEVESGRLDPLPAVTAP